MRQATLCMVLILLFLSPLSAVGGTGQKTVLLIISDRSTLTSNAVVSETIQTALGKQTDLPVDFRVEFINNTSRLPDQAEVPLRDFMRSKYAGERFDVVVCIGQDALRFFRNYGGDLFPGVPIVSWGSRDFVTRNWGDGPPVTGVLEVDRSHQVAGMLEFILALQPDLREVVVVSGKSDTDLIREVAARKALAAESRVNVTYLAGLPLEELQIRLTHLPRTSAVIFLSMIEDGLGRKLLTHDVLLRLAPKTTAPVYALSAVQIGTGIVGGLLVHQERMSQQAAEIVLQLLRGERVQDIPLQESAAVRMVDWRQLQRWGIPERRLPPGTEILHKELSMWEAYKWRILGTLALCLVEAALILTLLIQKRKRKRAEREAAASREQLQSTIDALQAHIALLDETGKIIAVNESWRRFAKINHFGDPMFGVGTDYLKICESSGSCEDAGAVKRGLEALMAGESSGFCRVYESSFEGSDRWYQLRATRFFSNGALRLAVAHEDITEIRRAYTIQQHYTGLLLQAQDDERRRIARDLHDVTVQNIVTIKADMAVARETSKDRARSGAEAFQGSLVLCDQVINELRTLSYLLHPPLLDEAGLVAAVQWYVRGFMQRSGIHVEVVVMDDIGRLSSDVETALFRVIQEGLTNIHRHSGGRSALLWVLEEEGEVVIRIHDDGHGMPELAEVKPGQAVGVGILGMRQRLRQLGGRLEIESDSCGTTVTARTPKKEGYIAYSRG